MTSGNEAKAPGLLAGLLAVARRDLLLAWKRPGDVLNPLFFFIMVCTLFPLAVGPSAEQLKFSGPGVLWVAALLAMLISLNSLFMSDFDDGSLEQLLVSPQPLPLLGLGKTVAHWLTSGLPLVLISPIVAVTYRMPGDVVVVLMLTLTLGSISLSLLGSIGAALTVGLKRGGLLMSLLVLPLYFPTLIFGAEAAARAAQEQSWQTPILLLAGITAGSLALLPFAGAMALRVNLR